MSSFGDFFESENTLSNSKTDDVSIAIAGDYSANSTSLEPGFDQQNEASLFRGVEVDYTEQYLKILGIWNYETIGRSLGIGTSMDADWDALWEDPGVRKVIATVFRNMWGTHFNTDPTALGIIPRAILNDWPMDIADDEFALHMNLNFHKWNNSLRLDASFRNRMLDVNNADGLRLHEVMLDWHISGIVIQSLPDPFDALLVVNFDGLEITDTADNNDDNGQQAQGRNKKGRWSANHNDNESRSILINDLSFDGWSQASHLVAGSETSNPIGQQVPIGSNYYQYASVNHQVDLMVQSLVLINNQVDSFDIIASRSEELETASQLISLRHESSIM